uniref:Ribosomal protein n=1 Tax=Nyssomyia neivai TaxID=330878 RepID=A0A1L8E122_9DIPT
MFPALGAILLRRCMNNVIPEVMRRSFHSLLPRVSFNQGIPAPATQTQLLICQGSPLLNLVCGFKVKGKLKRRCKDCYFVWRQQRLYVICKTHPRHKQMAMKKKEHNTWILTNASQSKVREW